jgi:hypothetical protein
MMEAIVLPIRRILQEPHGVASQKKAFFIVTAEKTSNLTTESQTTIIPNIWYHPRKPSSEHLLVLIHPISNFKI